MLRQVAAAWLAALVAASCDSSPRSRGGSDYEFLGVLQSAGMIPDAGGSFTPTPSAQTSWYAEFQVRQVIRGNPPVDDRGRVRYAINSPSELGIDGRVGQLFHVRADLVPWSGSVAHWIRVVSR